MERDAEQVVKVRGECDDLQRQVEAYERTLSEMETEVTNTRDELAESRHQTESARLELEDVVGALSEKDEELKSVTAEAREQL